MKHFNVIFDIFFYESFFVLFFGGILYLLKDPVSETLFTVSIVSFVIACILGIAGYSFNLFKEEYRPGDL
ncbi:MAG TPA: hypothetical protein VFD56_02555 [Chitinophagaceae bacterium]|nr:hypothetical protein [Chitinophagaceae bacterium]